MNIIESGVHDIVDNVNTNFFSGSRILVTGAAGFLGSWMVETLLAMNAEVVGIDDFSSGLQSNLHAALENENFQFIESDVTTFTKFDGELDAVIHMASRAGPFEFSKYPIQIIRSNTIGTENILNIAQEKDARVLFTSTSEVYGSPEIVPTPETYFGNVNPIGIRGCYDESKRCGEALCMAFLRQYDLDTRIVRIFNTYGPRIRPDGIYGRVIPRFIVQCLNNEDVTVFGDGLQTRSFTYVTDQLIGQLRLLSDDKMKGEVVNIGNDNEMTILALAETLIEQMGSGSKITYSPLPENDPLRRRPDITKAKRLLNWTPTTDIHDGLMKTAHYLKQNF